MRSPTPTTRHWPGGRASSPSGTRATCSWASASGMVLVSLIGGCETLLAAAGAGWWARPGVHRAFLAVSTAVVVSAAAVTSWAAQAGHDAPGRRPRPRPARVSWPRRSTVARPCDAGRRRTHASAPLGHGADRGPTGPTEDGAGQLGPTGARRRRPPTITSTATARRPAAGRQRPRHADRHEPPTAAAAGQGRPRPATTTPGRCGTPRPARRAPARVDQHAAVAGRTAAARTAPQGSWAESALRAVRRYRRRAPGGDADHANIAVPSLAKPCTQLLPAGVQARTGLRRRRTGQPRHRDDAPPRGPVQPPGGRTRPAGRSSPSPASSGSGSSPPATSAPRALFPPGFGYYVDSGNWSGIFHVMNHSTERQVGVLPAQGAVVAGGGRRRPPAARRSGST